MNIQIQDKNVLNVMARFKERSEVGIKKYKTTLERTDLTTLEWLQHTQEEAMDFVLYLERLKHEYKTKVKLLANIMIDKLIECTPSVNIYPYNFQQIQPRVKEYWIKVKTEINNI